MASGFAPSPSAIAQMQAARGQSAQPAAPVSGGKFGNVGLAKLQQMKAQSPAAANMSDAQFALAMHEHYYSDVPLTDFLKGVGLDRGDVLYETRAPGDTYGDYARKALAAPGAGESADQAATRQGGALPTRRAGTAEGMVRGYLQGGTLGFGDEMVAAGAAALDPLVHGNSGKDFGQRYSAYLGREQGLVNNFRQDNPAAAYGSEIAGSIPTMLAVPAPGGAGVGGALGRLGVNALEGGVYGAGSTDGDLKDRAIGAGIGMGTGATLGAVGEGIGNVVSGIAGRNATKKAIQQTVANAPAGSTIKAGSKAAFRASENTGAQVSQKSLQGLSQGAHQLASDEGLLLPSGVVTDGYAKAAGALKMISEYAKGNLSMKQSQALLKTARGVARTGGSEGEFGRKLVKTVIDHFDSMRPTDFVSHPANVPGQPFAANGGQDAVQFWKQGMSEWAKYKRTDAIEKIVYRANLSPRGFAEGLRSGFRKVLTSPRRQEGFSQAELAEIEKFVKGGKMDDLLGFIQKGSSLPIAVAGHMAGGPVVGAALGGAKIGASMGAGAIRNAGAKGVAEQVRARAAGAVLPPNVIPMPPRVPSPMIGRAATGAVLPVSDDPRQGLVKILVNGGRR